MLLIYDSFRNACLINVKNFLKAGALLFYERPDNGAGGELKKNTLASKGILKSDKTHN